VIESIVVLTKSRIITEQDLPVGVLSKDEKSSLKIPVGVSLADAEKQLIMFTLEYTGGNKTKASEVLKIGRKTLHRKLSEYGIAEFTKK